LLADDTRYPLLVVVIDLDYFKQINDAFGHAAGDEVLITVGRRFTCYAGDNLVARLGGDEFAGLLASPTVDSSWLSQVRHCLADVLSAPMTVAGNQLVVTASIGLVPVNCRVHLATALHDADVAMYRAKLSARQARPRFQPLESVIVAESLTRQSARLRHRPSLADRTSGMEATGS